MNTCAQQILIFIVLFSSQTIYLRARAHRAFFCTPMLFIWYWLDFVFTHLTVIWKKKRVVGLAKTFIFRFNSRENEKKINYVFLLEKKSRTKIFDSAHGCESERERAPARARMERLGRSKLGQLRARFRFIYRHCIRLLLIFLEIVFFCNSSLPIKVTKIKVYARTHMNSAIAALLPVPQTIWFSHFWVI